MKLHTKLASRQYACVAMSSVNTQQSILFSAQIETVRGDCDVPGFSLVWFLPRNIMPAEYIIYCF